MQYPTTGLEPATRRQPLRVSILLRSSRPDGGRHITDLWEVKADGTEGPAQVIALEDVAQQEQTFELGVIDRRSIRSRADPNFIAGTGKQAHGRVLKAARWQADL